MTDLTVRSTIPIPIFSCATQKNAYELPLMRYAFLVATRAEDREAFLGFAVPRDKPLPKTPPGTKADEAQMMTENLLPDLKQRLGLGNDSGTYDVVVLVRENVSNRVRVVVNKPAGYSDPAVEKFIAQQPVPSPAPVSPAPAAGAALPSYRRVEGSPEVPGSPGIAVAAPRVNVLREGGQLAVSGTFKVPLLKRELTGAAAGKDAPTAIVPVLLLAFSSDPGRFGPFVMKLRVPVYDELPAADPVGTGHFSVNLLDLAGLPAKAATLFVYAFAGEWMVGPIPVGLVTPDMLPK